MEASEKSLEKAFLEELIGPKFYVIGKEPVFDDDISLFKIYNTVHWRESIPFAVIMFCKHEEGDYLRVRFDGNNYFFDFDNINWIDSFEEIWQQKVEEMERRTKRKFRNHIEEKISRLSSADRALDL